MQDHHYNTVGSVLLWTFVQGLGKEFTPEVCEARTAVYTTLASAMKDAAREDRAVA